MNIFILIFRGSKEIRQVTDKNTSSLITLWQIRHIKDLELIPSVVLVAALFNPAIPWNSQDEIQNNVNENEGGHHYPEKSKSEK